MKLYQIPKGTNGLVLTATKFKQKFDNGGRVVRFDDGVPYKTTKDLTFTETVTDPIRAANGERVYSKIEALALIGYAIFEEQTDTHIYYLAIQYNEVEVLA